MQSVLYCWRESLLVTIISAARAESPPKAATFQVVTYNIRYDNPGDGPNVWTNRREAMVKYLRETKADLIGMQEVLPQQRDYLAEQLSEYAWYSVGRDDGVKGEATPIFYRKDRYELLEKGTFWLSDAPDKAGSKGWDAGLPRRCLVGQVRDKQAGKSLLFVNTHFDNRGVEARSRRETPRPEDRRARRRRSRFAPRRADGRFQLHGEAGTIQGAGWPAR